MGILLHGDRVRSDCHPRAYQTFDDNFLVPPQTIGNNPQPIYPLSQSNLTVFSLIIFPNDKHIVFPHPLKGNLARFLSVPECVTGFFKFR